MKRLTTRMALAMTLTMLASGVVVGVSAAPASASRTYDLICELVDENGDHFKITAIAYYEDNTIGPGLRRWYEFRYLLETTLIDRGRNNVNIRLSESGQRVYTYYSPDDRREGLWYILRPSSLILTSVWGPLGEHDHRANDLIEFEAIFDVPEAGDPHCTAWTLV